MDEHEPSAHREANSKDRGQGMTSPFGDVIDLRLPPKAAYRTALRAILGAIAATVSFNYDEIMQLRIAVSDAFDMAVRHMAQRPQAPEEAGVDIRFIITADTIEFTVSAPFDGGKILGDEPDFESQGVIRGIMDEVDLGPGTDNKTVVRAVKRRSSPADH
ncbi:MAG: ATP-binding protein [Chloroflexi bacterium]|nr:ATP-binding protein [Chloroflexota bacterium]